MEILTLKLSSKNLNKQKAFYKHLGFHIDQSQPDKFQIQAGQTALQFQSSDQVFNYHFAFLIPTGQLEKAIHYLQQKEIPLLSFEGNNVIDFGTGRAIYFFDEDQNIVEFIERPSLNISNNNVFDIHQIVKINEIGIPTTDTLQLAQELIDRFNIQLAEPSIMREDFRWIGDYNGVFLVTKVGRHWLPTDIECKINDFEIEFESMNGHFTVNYVNGQITVPQL